MGMATTFRRDRATEGDPVAALAKLASDLGMTPVELAARLEATAEQRLEPMSVVVTLAGSDSDRSGS